MGNHLLLFNLTGENTMSNKWRKEFRYSITKNGKFYNQYQDQNKAIKICRDLEKDGHIVTIKKVEVEVMPISLFKDIFGE